MKPTVYERATAIVIHTTITRGIEMSFPRLSLEDREAMFIGIIDQLARMHGWAVKREYILSEEQGE